MISAPGFEQLVTHIFVAGDQYLDSDVVFGVKGDLVREFVLRNPGEEADGRATNRKYYYLNYNFGLKRAGESSHSVESAKISRIPVAQT